MFIKVHTTIKEYQHQLYAGEFGSVRSRILVLRSVCDDGKLDELSNKHLVRLSDLAVMQIVG